MGKPDPIVEWHMVESDEEWERLCLPPLTDGMLTTVLSSRVHSLSKQLIWGAVTIFLLFVDTGVWWRYTTQVGLEQGEAELRTMLQRKKAFTLDGENIILQTVMIQGEQAVAHVVTGGQSGASVYRQTRFYQHTDVGWQPTAPNAVLWGPEHSLETPFFVFHFRQDDAAAVIAVVPQVEALYTTLRRNVGLAIKPNVEKLIIEVSITQPPGALAWIRVPEVLRVPSPAVYWAPSELTDAELLLQSIALPLRAYVLQQAREHYAISSTWQPLLNGLDLWQLWDLHLPLSGWREDIVKWLYQDLPATRAGKVVVLPDHYTALCAMHKLWMQSPLLMNIPIVCAELDLENRFLSPWILHAPLMRLDQIAVPISADEYINQSATSTVFNPGQTVALATLIEYTVTTYGRARLPILLAGLGQYESWHTLLPAVYGVSPAAFEAGWQTYLATRYGIVE